MADSDRETTYPGNDGRPIRHDPTHGKIDREVQWFVQDTYDPDTLSMRVAMESNVQAKRDARCPD